MKRYAEDAPAGAFEEYSGPSRAPSLGADVVAPILQSVFLAGVAGGVLAGVGALFGAPLWPTWPLCAGVLTIGVYYWRQGVADDTLRETQRTDSRPVTVQRVAVEPAGHILIGARGGRQALARDNAARGRQEFLQFVRGCERDTSMRFWQSRIGRDKYTRWRDELLSSGWAEREGDAPNAPWRLTATAEEIAAAIDAGE